MNIISVIVEIIVGAIAALGIIFVLMPGAKYIRTRKKSKEGAGVSRIDR